MSGAVRKNPGRYRARKEAAAARVGLPALGAPPEAWVKDQEINGRCRALIEIWNQFVAQDAIGLRVLNASHWMLVKNACQLQYKIDQSMAGWGKATSGDWSTLKSYLSSMGMTPIDSSRVAEAVRIPERTPGSSSARSGLSWGEYVG